MRVAVVMAIGNDELPRWLLSSTPSDRFVSSLTARFRLMTVAVSQS